MEEFTILPGDRVDHETLGLGTVARTTDTTVEIRLDDAGIALTIDPVDTEPHPTIDGAWYAWGGETRRGS